MLETSDRYDTSQDSCYEFGPFRLVPSEQLLLREKNPVALAPKTFQLLTILVAQRGHLVTRETLMKIVWPDSFVEETNLTVNISLLRKILGDAPDGRPWIATIPKHGYRFDGEVTVISGQYAQPAATAPKPVLATPSVTENDPQAPQLDVAVQIPEQSAESIAPAPNTPAAIISSTARYKFNRRWLWLAAMVVLIVAGIWLAIVIYRSRHSAPSHSIHVIAVLPFQTASNDEENEYLGVGLTDALISRLGRLSQLVVRPIGAVRSFAKTADPVAVGKQLDVQAVLTGAVERVGDHTHVAVRLFGVNDGRTIWSDSYDDRNSSDFEIEESISQRLVSALTLQLSQGEQRQLATPNTPNNQAYELYIQGRYYWNKRSVESVQKSIELFRQATDLDPNYAAAWSGLSDAWILAGSYGNSFLAPGVAMPRAKQAAEKALAIDDSSAEAHTSLAYIHFTWDWDFAGAEREFKRALEINPGYVNAHHWYSHELVALGRIGESHEQSETALGLDPTDVVINEHMAWHHMMAREYDRAIPQANKAIELDPGFVQAHRVLGLSLLYDGKPKEACAEFEKGLQLSHGDPVANAYLARCYALTHREFEARRMLPPLEAASGERYISAAEIAAVYAALNDVDEALKWLDKACAERSSSLIYLNTDRIWDPLRSNPKFQTDVKRVGLPIMQDETGSQSSAHP